MENGNGEHENVSLYDSSSCNVNANELDEETNIKLRGDAIGDTLYSQSFVLKTLLQFSDLKWNEELEENLCFLWDMTVEKDVCEYLFEISFPAVTSTALEKYTESRFIEIVVGILANILCADCEKNITRDEITIVLKELDTDDHLILIQVVRFLSALAHTFNDLSFITDDILNKLIFILNNSTNNELLMKTLEAMSKLTSNFKLDKRLISAEIVKSSLITYKLLDEMDEYDLSTKDRQLVCKYMLTIVSNFCAYIDQYNMNNLMVQFKEFSDVFINEIIDILRWYSYEENLVPVTDDFIFYMSVLRFVLETLNVNYLSDIFFPVTKILCIISDFKDDVVELFDNVIELECYLVSRVNPQILCQDFKKLPKANANKILSLIKENQQKFDFTFDIQYISDKL